MADLTAKASLDSQAFQAGLQQLTKQTMSFSKTVESVAGAFGVGFTVHEVMALRKEFTELGKEIVNNAAKAGIGVESYQALNHSFEESGNDAGDLIRILTRLQDASSELSDPKKVKAFADLGISMQEMQSLAPDQLLEKIAIAYNAASDKAALFKDITDIVGLKAVPALRSALEELGSKGLSALVKDYENSGRMIDKATAESLKEAGKNWDQFFQTIKIAGAKTYNFLVESETQYLARLLNVWDRFYAKQKSDWEKLKSWFGVKPPMIEIPPDQKGGEPDNKTATNSETGSTASRSPFRYGAGASADEIEKLRQRNAEAQAAAERESMNRAQRRKAMEAEISELKRKTADTEKEDEENKGKIIALQAKLNAEDKAEREAQKRFEEEQAERKTRIARVSMTAKQKELSLIQEAVKLEDRADRARKAGDNDEARRLKTRAMEARNELENVREQEKTRLKSAAEKRLEDQKSLVETLNEGRREFNRIAEDKNRFDFSGAVAKPDNWQRVGGYMGGEGSMQRERLAAKAADIAQDQADFIKNRLAPQIAENLSKIMGLQ